MDELEARLQGCFQAVFPAMGPDEILSASVESTSTWDSIATVNLINLIEDEFGIQLDLDDLSQYSSYSAFVETIHRSR